jgi:diguanylate cyclase (GGDEF)-like protein
MDRHAKETAMPVAGKAPPLATALNKSEQVTDKVEERGHDLSTINQVFLHEINDPLPVGQVKPALHQGGDAALKVQERGDDLSLANQAMGKEIRERKRLERKLAESEMELADTQAQLSDSQVQEKRSRHLALHDVVTGLPNRSLLDDRLRNALAQARRHAWRFAVMFIDLDRFKSINDSYGHDVGDKVLKIVAGRLQSSVRGADSVGRQGGDEFLYLMLEIRDEAHVANAAAKIIENIAQPCEFDGLKLTIKPSIGIALYPLDGKSAEVLLKNADSAMYKAKQSNKGYWFYALRG